MEWGCADHAASLRRPACECRLLGACLQSRAALGESPRPSRAGSPGSVRVAQQEVLPCAVLTAASCTRGPTWSGFQLSSCLLGRDGSGCERDECPSSTACRVSVPQAPTAASDLCCDMTPVPLVVCGPKARPASKVRPGEGSATLLHRVGQLIFLPIPLSHHLPLSLALPLPFCSLGSTILTAVLSASCLTQVWGPLFALL